MEKVNKLLTVVVPVYKVEPYINKCLDSLLVPADQLEKLEVIVVNDGTPDRSAEMAREYEKLYPQTFRVIDKENGGHGSAWNRGLKEATGKYLRFLDSDDWFDTNELGRLMDRLEGLDVDMIVSHYNRYYVQSGEYEKHLMFCDSLDKTFAVEDFEWDKLSWERFNFWGCTYRTQTLQKEYPLFMEGVFYDDAILFISPVYLCRTIHIFDATIYNYLIGRPGQTMAPEVRMKHMNYWVRTHFQAFEFGISHSDAITDEPRKKYVTDFYREWVHECLVKLTTLPYSQAKKLTKECLSLYSRLEGAMSGQDFSTKTIRACNKLPYPFFYILMRTLSLFRKDE